MDSFEKQFWKENPDYEEPIDGKYRGKREGMYYVGDGHYECYNCCGSGEYWDPVDRQFHTDM